MIYNIIFKFRCLCSSQQEGEAVKTLKVLSIKTAPVRGIMYVICLFPSPDKSRSFVVLCNYTDHKHRLLTLSVNF